MQNPQMQIEQIKVEVIATHLFFFFTLIVAASSQIFQAPSGKSINIAAVRYHIPSVSEDVLPHCIFEYDPGEGLLRSQFALLNISFLAPRIERIPEHHPNTTVRSGNDYTFAFDISSKTLIAAWGPYLQIHPLDSSTHPNIFINSVTYEERTVIWHKKRNVDRVAHVLSILQPRQPFPTDKKPGPTCIVEKEIVVLTILAPSFTKMFDSDAEKSKQATDVLYHRLSQLFMSVACVRIKH